MELVEYFSSKTPRDPYEFIKQIQDFGFEETETDMFPCYYEHKLDGSSIIILSQRSFVQIRDYDFFWISFSVPYWEAFTWNVYQI